MSEQARFDLRNFSIHALGHLAQVVHFHRESTPSREFVPDHINSVAIFGIGGQTGGLFNEELERAQKQDGSHLNIMGVGRGPKDVIMEQNPDIVILATPNILTTPNPFEQSLRELAVSIEGKPKPNFILVLPQNGLDVVLLAREILGKRINIVRASLMTPVHKDIYDRSKLRIALAQTDGKGVVDVEKVFKSSGFKTKICPEWEVMERSKLLLNLLGSTGAITFLPLKDTLQDEELFRIEVKAMRDRLAILRADGYDVIDLPGVPLKLLTGIMENVPLEILVRSRHIIAKLVAGHRINYPPAAASKIQEGKPTESFSYHDPFIRIGRQYGLRSPIDEAILDLINEHRLREFLNKPTMNLETRKQLLVQAIHRRERG